MGDRELMNGGQYASRTERINNDVQFVQVSQEAPCFLCGNLPFDLRLCQNSADLVALEHWYECQAISRPELVQHAICVGMVASIEAPAHGHGIIKHEAGHARPSQPQAITSSISKPLERGR